MEKGTKVKKDDIRREIKKGLTGRVKDIEKGIIGARDMSHSRIHNSDSSIVDLKIEVIPKLGTKSKMKNVKKAKTRQMTPKKSKNHEIIETKKKALETKRRLKEIKKKSVELKKKSTERSKITL